MMTGVSLIALTMIAVGHIEAIALTLSPRLDCRAAVLVTMSVSVMPRISMSSVVMSTSVSIVANRGEILLF